MSNGRNRVAEPRGARPGGPCGPSGRQRACAGRARQSPPAPRESALPGLRSRWGGGGASERTRRGRFLRSLGRALRRDAVSQSSRSFWGRAAPKSRVEASCPHRWLGSRRLTLEGAGQGARRRWGPQRRIAHNLRAPPCPALPSAALPSARGMALGGPARDACAGGGTPRIRGVPSPDGPSPRCSPQIPERTAPGRTERAPRSEAACRACLHSASPGFKLRARGAPPTPCRAQAQAQAQAPPRGCAPESAGSAHAGGSSRWLHLGGAAWLLWGGGHLLSVCLSVLILRSSP